MTAYTDLVEVTINRHYDCFGDHCETTTVIMQRQHLPALVESRIGELYADKVDMDDWPGWKPKPTAAEVIEQAWQGGWRSQPDDEHYDDYYFVYISPLIVWQPATKDTP